MTRRQALLAVTGLLLVNVLARSLPHPANFAPVTATGLFCGAHMGRRSSLILTIVVLLASDYLLLYTSPFANTTAAAVYVPWKLWYGTTQLFVYGSFAVSALAGRWLKTHRSGLDLLVVSMFCSLQFFFITNAAVWLDGAYARDLRGLYDAWVAGLPFFKGTLTGDLFYAAVFFGVYAWLRAGRASVAIAASQGAPPLSSTQQTV